MKKRISIDLEPKEFEVLAIRAIKSGTKPKLLAEQILKSELKTKGK